MKLTKCALSSKAHQTGQLTGLMGNRTKVRSRLETRHCGIRRPRRANVDGTLTECCPQVCKVDDTARKVNNGGLKALRARNVKGGRQVMPL